MHLKKAKNSPKSPAKTTQTPQPESKGFRLDHALLFFGWSLQSVYRGCLWLDWVTGVLSTAVLEIDFPKPRGESLLHSLESNGLCMT